MKTTPTPLGKQSLATIGISALLLISLRGCIGPKVAPTKPSAAPATATAPQATATERGGSESTLDPSAGAAPAQGVGNPGKLTPAGTALKLGDTAITHVSSGEEGAEKYKLATFNATVTKIEAGTEADLSKFKDAAKFAGQTPYYVYTDITLTSLSKPSAGLSDPRIIGHLKDGTEAQKLIVFGSIGNCKNTSFKTQGKDDDFSYVVGSTKQTCAVFLAPTGDAVTSASFNDSGFRYANSSDNPYRDSPITWDK